MRQEITFHLNGTPVTLSCDGRDIMADVLAERLTMRGIRVACDQNVCGACTILCDGEPIASCTTFAFMADGHAITTLEGLEPAIVAVLREHFAKEIGFQCGFCTPGMLVTATALLKRSPIPSRDEIVDWMRGNLCRCTGYDAILKAIERAAETLSGAERTA